MVDRIQALLNVRADAELGSRSEHDPNLPRVELAAQFGLRGWPLVIVNEGDLMLRDSLGHEHALDFMVDGEPRLALVFSLDDRVRHDGWVIRRFCYMSRSSHMVLPSQSGLAQSSRHGRRDPGRSAVRSECSH